MHPSFLLTKVGGWFPKLFFLLWWFLLFSDGSVVAWLHCSCSVSLQLRQEGQRYLQTPVSIVSPPFFSSVLCCPPSLLSAIQCLSWSWHPLVPSASDTPTSTGVISTACEKLAPTPTWTHASNILSKYYSWWHNLNWIKNMLCVKWSKMQKTGNDCGFDT